MLAVGLAGCGASARTSSERTERLPADYIPIPTGRTAPYRLPATSAGVARRAPVAGLRCGPPGSHPYGVHLELYARRLVVPVPAGIGVAPPQRRRGAYVLGGACIYPLRTFEPTGVIVVDRAVSARAPTPTLGALFAIWGQPLSTARLAGFRGPVAAFVGGRPWRRPPQEIPLTPHAEIVLEVGGPVPPHRTYLFGPGL